MRIDERQTAGRRVYMGAQRCLSSAWDNHDALLALLRHHGATQFAPWNLLRPTFEASFYALWLLDPDDSLERRRRGLRFEWLDELEHRTYYSDLAAIERFIDPRQRDELDADGDVSRRFATSMIVLTAARLKSLAWLGRCRRASTFRTSSGS